MVVLNNGMIRMEFMPKVSCEWPIDGFTKYHNSRSRFLKKTRINSNMRNGIYTLSDKSNIMRKVKWHLPFDCMIRVNGFCNETNISRIENESYMLLESECRQLSEITDHISLIQSPLSFIFLLCMKSQYHLEHYNIKSNIGSSLAYELTFPYLYYDYGTISLIDAYYFNNNKDIIIDFSINNDNFRAEAVRNYNEHNPNTGRMISRIGTMPGYESSLRELAASWGVPTAN